MLVVSPNLGWNSGGRSIQRWSGDCQTTFSVPSTVQGVVCGLNDVDKTTDYREIKYALYFSKINGVATAQIYESGIQKTSGVSYATTDIFTVRRVGTVVTYLQNSTLLYTSTTPSTIARFKTKL